MTIDEQKVSEMRDETQVRSQVKRNNDDMYSFPIDLIL